MTYTSNQAFNRVLEIQQSKTALICTNVPSDLVAGFEPSSQTAAIEDLMSKKAAPLAVLRLLCLQSLVGGSLKPREIETLKKQFLQVICIWLLSHMQSYGYEHLTTFDSLERAGLFLPKPASIKSNYSTLRKALKLIVDDVDEQKPDDIAYVYSGYAPLSIRLIQCIIQKPVMLAAQAASAQQGRLVNTLSAFPNAMGWRGFEEPLKLVRGRTFDDIQKQEDKAMRAKRATFIRIVALTLVGLLNGAENKASVIFFLGGCTYTEIAAVRFIAQHEGKSPAV
jgi:hypothetical protein